MNWETQEGNSFIIFSLDRYTHEGLTKNYFQFLFKQKHSQDYSGLSGCGKGVVGA